MEVKGSVLSSVPKFVRKQFGDDAVASWLKRLSPQAREVYTNPIMPSMWYPIIPCLAEPTIAICDLFFNGDLNGAWESGRFTADEALTGLYKVFAIVGSTHTILKKGALAMSLLYRPSEIALTEYKEYNATLTISAFGEPHRALDARLGGFIERSLTVCGCKNVIVKTGRLMTKGDPCSEYLVSCG